jgi:GrpB-like predicted nucleotidyltransferase (UPF0157 family)
MERTPDDTDWHNQFVRERERLVGALSEITGGGIVEQIEHIGATSVAGLLGQPCVDLAVSVWPFPLEVRARQALTSLGYEHDQDDVSTAVQRFRHTSETFRLYIVEAGSAPWTDYLVVREYLRHDAAARQALSARKQGWDSSAEAAEYHAAKRQWLDQLVGQAHQWWIEHVGFTPLQAVADELRDFPAPWHFCGGWALDVFLGRVTRVHHDVDVVVSRADQLALQQHMTARGWTLLTPFDGRLQLWPMHMRLELPRHQAHALRRGAFIDFLLADLDGGVWRYRRGPVVIRDADRIGLQSTEGIPFLAPELVLLFKSKNTSGRERSNDQADFEETYATLEPERRAWLRWALTAVEPSHPWLERL